MRNSRHVEVFGLPGSGKSSLVAQATRSPEVRRKHAVLKRAAGRWFAGEILHRPRLARPCANEVVLRYYHSRLRMAVSAMGREFPELAEHIAAWLQLGVHGEVVTSARYLEHVATMFEVIKTSYLLEKYDSGATPVLLDEHWVSLLLTRLNWGSRPAFEKWLGAVIPFVPLSSRVVWLSHVADVSEQRQIARGRGSLLFDGCHDIRAKCLEFERSITWAISLLRDIGVEVLEVDCRRDLDDTRREVLEWLRRV